MMTIDLPVDLGAGSRGCRGVFKLLADSYSELPDRVVRTCQQVEHGCDPVSHPLSEAPSSTPRIASSE